MGKSDTYTGSSSQNTWMIKQMRANGYKQGGTIGDLISQTGEDGFILARAGEAVITPETVESFGEVFELMTPLIDTLTSLDLTTIPDNIATNTTTSIQIGDIQMYGVNDPEEFAEQLKDNLQNNKSVIKVIQANTLGVMNGHNSLNRYKY